MDKIKTELDEAWLQGFPGFQDMSKAELTQSKMIIDLLCGFLHDLYLEGYEFPNGTDSPPISNQNKNNKAYEDSS